MRIFITGIRGQLGTALTKRWPAAQVSGCDLPECDISQLQPTLDAVADARPQVVIHCAAWTDVDGCARDPIRAYQVNAIGTQHVALAARAVGARLLLLSSNEVFDGTQAAPYSEQDAPCPANPYCGCENLLESGAIVDPQLRFCRNPYSSSTTRRHPHNEFALKGYLYH